MATAPFAALEARANAVAMARLSNAVAVYAPAVGAARDLLVIFDSEYQEVVEGMVATTGPAAVYSALDVPAMARGETLAIRGVTYEVVKPLPDSNGLNVVRLRVAA
jgi:hypothetical protein